MKPDITKHHNYVLLKFNETKLNALTSANLRAELMHLNADGHNTIITDLASAKFVDSSGLGCLLAGHKLCKDAGGAFILTGLNDAVTRLIAIAQLNSVLSVTATTADAIAQLTASGPEAN